MRKKPCVTDKVHLKKKKHMIMLDVIIYGT